MDFGLMGMEGLVGQNQQQQQDSGSSDQDGKRKCGGSGFVKQEGSGSGSSEEEDASRVSKMARYGQDLGISKATVSQQQEVLAPLLRSADGALGRPPQSQMLSFASPRSEVSFLSTNKDGGGGGGGGGDKNAQTLPLSYFQHSTAPVYTRNAGYASGNMHGSFTGIRGPFTPAQWIELEHQALIYKYLTANVPVPATLLIPIRKALNPSGFTGFSAVSFPAHSYGWGPFHLGYSGSADPEPGRCRRTDGKKWRCSRDAVPDQKYCERHINRGRHRSRKPVEGQTGQAAAGTTNPKVLPMSSSGGSATNSLAIGSHQLKNLQAGASHPGTDRVVNRLQDTQGHSVMPTSISLRAKDLPFSIPKQHIPYEESSQSEFGFVSTDSLLNPSAKNSFLSCKNYNSFLDFNDQQSEDQHQVRQVVDDWHKDPSSRSTIPWPEELKSDWTQLSMAMPMTELSSSSSYQEKLALSPLRLSRELDQTQMGLGVGSALNDAGSKNGNWIPISWGSSMGGPLGEVLNNAGSAVGSCKSTSGLDLMGEGWDGSPQLGSSPTGVLQKGAFVSHSNSGGSGSSPTTENKKTQEGACLGDDLLGSAHASSSSTPTV